MKGAVYDIKSISVIQRLSWDRLCTALNMEVPELVANGANSKNSVKNGSSADRTKGVNLGENTGWALCFRKHYQHSAI